LFNPPPDRSRSHRRARAVRRRGWLFLVLTVLVAAAAVVVWRVANKRSDSAVSARSTTTTAVATTLPAPYQTTTTVPPPYEPPPVVPVASPPLPGEGQWVPLDAWNPDVPSVLGTTFRPEPSQPAITAYAAWLRTETTQLALYPGYKGPGPTPLARGAEMVPLSGRANLLAVFNSGFYEADAHAGFFVHNTLYFPMVNGMATVISYADGHVDLVDWQGGPTPTPDIVMARQNLPLLVNAGTIVPSASVGHQWGSTLGGAPAVWRTGLGIDPQGNLIYVAAPAQTALSLAHILLRVGAVRGMQLDINPMWPIFATYGGPDAAVPTLFVHNPNQVASRFLNASTKDFFAVFRRLPGVPDQPW
jgi:hypothetical protein